MVSDPDPRRAEEEAERLNAILLSVGPVLSPIVYRMALAAESTGNWRLGDDAGINHRKIPTVESIKDANDHSGLLTVMLSTWRIDAPAPIPELRDIGLDRRFVLKIRRIRHTCAHPTSADHPRQLSDPAWVRDSYRAARDFVEMVHAIFVQTSSPSGSGANQRPVRGQADSAPPPTLDDFAPDRDRRSETQRMDAQPESTVRQRGTSIWHHGRRRMFLLRPEFWALFAGAVAAVGIDFWGSGGVPEDGAVWQSPMTAAGIICAIFALLSGLMSGRAVRVSAILPLMLLPVLVFLFALYLSEKADSDGFYVLLGAVAVFWALVTALMPVIAVLRFLGDFRIVR